MVILQVTTNSDSEHNVSDDPVLEDESCQMQGSRVIVHACRIVTKHQVADHEFRQPFPGANHRSGQIPIKGTPHVVYGGDQGLAECQ